MSRHEGKGPLRRGISGDIFELSIAAGRHTLFNIIPGGLCAIIARRATVRKK
jgi:hypothetical protein